MEKRSEWTDIHTGTQVKGPWSSFVEKTTKERTNSVGSTDSLLSSSQGHTDGENNDNKSSSDNPSFYSENSSMMNSDLDSDSSHSSPSSRSNLNELVTSDMFLNLHDQGEFNQEYPVQEHIRQSISSEMDSEVDQWGWFDDNDHAMGIQEGRNLRSAWYRTVDSLHPQGSHILPVKSDVEFSLLETLSRTDNTHGNFRMGGVDQNDSIIVQWVNPNPSMSLTSSKSSTHCPSSLSGLGGDEMQISGCISGFRIKRSELGMMHAEFHYMFCYGSETYNSWKRFGEFEKLHEIIRHFDDGGYCDFSKSIQQWNNVKEKQKPCRCLSVLYLIEKSVYLGKYVQDLLIESEAPGLLLMFARCERLEI